MLPCHPRAVQVDVDGHAADQTSHEDQSRACLLDTGHEKIERSDDRAGQEDIHAGVMARLKEDRATAQEERRQRACDRAVETTAEQEQEP